MKNGLFWRVMFLLGTVAAISGCTDSSISSRDQITPTYLFYADGNTSTPDLGFYAVDPADPGNPITVIDPSVQQAHVPTFFLAGTVEQSKGTIADLHYKYVVYPAGAGNNFLYRLNAERSQSLTRQRVSSESTANIMCGLLSADGTGMGFEDYANPEKSVLFYAKDPLDADACDNSGNESLFMVRLDMTQGTAPIALGSGFFPVAPSYNTDGSLAGFLLYDIGSSTLKLYDAALSGPVTVLTGVTMGAIALASDPLGRMLLLVDDTDFHVFDPASGTVSPSRHTEIQSLNSLSILIDNGYAYFQDGERVLRLPMDGSAVASIVADESAGTGNMYEFFQVSSGKVIYWYDDSGGAPSEETLRSVPVSGGTPTTLFTLPGVAGIRSIRAAAGRIYFSLNTTPPRAISVNDDGSNLQVEGYAWWSGFTYHPRQPMFADFDLLGRQGQGFAMARMSPNVIYQMRFSSTGGGNTFKSFDADTTALLADYGVPVTDFGPWDAGLGGDYPPVVHGLATNNQTLVFFDNAAGFKDAIFLHARDSLSVVRVTNSTSTAREANYYGIIGGCSFGNGRFDPLLPVLLVIAAMYVLRRQRGRRRRGNTPG